MPNRPVPGRHALDGVGYQRPRPLPGRQPITAADVAFTFNKFMTEAYRSFAPITKASRSRPFPG
ncbi:hypothetical protein M8494_04895 [Serratia ureilytica]